MKKNFQEKYKGLRRLNKNNRNKKNRDKKKAAQGGL